VSSLRRLLARLLNALRPWRAEPEFEREIASHLALIEEDYLRRGLSPEEAAFAARRTLGSVALTADRHRDARSFRWMDDTRRDLLYAARLLRRSPGFTTITVLTLALGIGANVAVFSLINAVMLQPLPVRHPENLVELLFKFPGDPRLNEYWWMDYEHLRDGNDVFSNLIAVSLDHRQVSNDALAPEVVACMYVGGDFFDVLGIRPAIGRLIGPEHARVGTPESAVAVISWSYWQRRFNLDPGAVGTSVLIDRVPMRIVGVAPRGFFGLQLGIEPPVWLPIAAEPLLQHPSRLNDGSLRVAIFGRLKPGISLDQATAEIRVLDRPRLERYVARLKDPRFREVQIEAVPAATGITMYAPNLRDRFGSAFSWTMAAVGVLLVIACVNVASLLLARGAARQREMAVRVALGAGHLRLFRQLLTESLLLATCGGAFGVLLAYGAAGTLGRFFASGRAPVGVPEGLQIAVHVDVHVLLFAVGAAMATGVLVGLVPAWHAFMSSPSTSLRAVGAASETRSARVFGQALVVAQVGLSVVLLSAAALFVRHLAELRTVGVGFESQSVLQVKLDLSRSGRKPEELAPLYQQLVQRMAALPGIHSASFSAMTPISGAAGRLFVSVAGFVERPEDRRRVSLNGVAPGYFETLSTPFIAGRDFQAADAGGPRVAIVNQAMARHYFGASNPIGRHFTFEGQARPLEIVGVVADAKYLDLHETPPRTAYENALQGFDSTTPKFLLRTDVPPLSVVPDVRRAVDAVLPNVSLSVQTLREQLDASILPERLIAMLSALFGALAAALVAIGLYGLLSYMVERRINEIGIRIALGATSRDIVLMVGAGALPLVFGGFAVGAPIALAARVYAGKVLTLVAATQAQAPITLPASAAWPIVGAAGAMIAVALVASCIPARRATKVDPIEALRFE
jgi:putative ABC transport system permease protein